MPRLHAIVLLTAIGVASALVLEARPGDAFAIPRRRHITVLVGNSVDLGERQSFSENYLIGTQVTIERPCDLRKFGELAINGGSSAIFALYTDEGGAPKDEVAASRAALLTPGRNEIEVSPVHLLPGTYWLMKDYDKETDIAGDTSWTTPVRYISLPFGDPLPATFPPDSSSYGGAKWNEYLVVME